MTNNEATKSVSPIPRPLSVYRVQVLKNLSLQAVTSFQATGPKMKGVYLSCDNGVVHVITDDPKNIYDTFGTNIVSIEKIGIGYTL